MSEIFFQELKEKRATSVQTFIYFVNKENLFLDVSNLEWMSKIDCTELEFLLMEILLHVEKLLSFRTSYIRNELAFNSWC